MDSESKPPKLLYSIKDLSEMIGLKRFSIYKLIEHGYIDCVKLEHGKGTTRFMFTMDMIQKFIDINTYSVGKNKGVQDGN